MTAILISFTVFLLYNIVSIALFNVPPSLSETFYLYKEKNPYLKFLFPIMMCTCAFLLLPAWLSIPSTFQFLAFLAPAGIIFTGMAPMFKVSLEKAVHSTSAIIAAVASLLWIILVAKMWYIILIWLFIITILAITSKTYKNITYWLEIIAFMSTYTTLIFCYL